MFPIVNVTRENLRTYTKQIQKLLERKFLDGGITLQEYARMSDMFMVGILGWEFYARDNGRSL